MISGLLNIFILLYAHIKGPDENLTFCISIAIALMWFKVFYWLRIFANTAFFYNLIMKTMDDILAFMIMLGTAIAAFANFFFIHN